MNTIGTQLLRAIAMAILILRNLRERQFLPHLHRAQQPIVAGKRCGFVCFKIPGKEGYHFFHQYRLRTRDCWEGYLKERK